MKKFVTLLFNNRIIQTLSLCYDKRKVIKNNK